MIVTFDEFLDHIMEEGWLQQPDVKNGQVVIRAAGLDEELSLSEIPEEIVQSPYKGIDLLYGKGLTVGRPTRDDIYRSIDETFFKCGGFNLKVFAPPETREDPKEEQELPSLARIISSWFRYGDPQDNLLVHYFKPALGYLTED